MSDGYRFIGGVLCNEDGDTPYINPMDRALQHARENMDGAPDAMAPSKYLALVAAQYGVDADALIEAFEQAPTAQEGSDHGR